MLSYAITDPSTLNFSTLKQDVKRFSQKADMIVYRDKSSLNYASNAKDFLDECKKYNFKKILLHTDYELAHKLNADGVHLNSRQFNEINKAKNLGLFVIISTHSIKEALNAQNLGADMITYSPIFDTPNKGEAKGVEELKKLTRMLKIPVVALGGIISNKQIAQCQKNHAKGFASIRYFI